MRDVPPSPLRLSFPAKLMGVAGMKTSDTRRWRKHPHLMCSLELLDRVLDHLKTKRSDMHRMATPR